MSRSHTKARKNQRRRARIAAPATQGQGGTP